MTHARDATAGFIVRWNAVLTAFLALALIGFAAGIPKVRISWDDRGFFGSQNAEFIRLQELEDTYSGAQVLLFMVVPPAGQAFAPPTLSTLRQMTEDAWQIPYTLRVDSPTNFNHSRAEGDDLIVEPLLADDDDITAADAARFRAIALSDPQLVERLVAKNGESFGIRATIAPPDGDRGARDDIAAFARQLIADWESRDPGFDIRITGGILGGLTLAEAALDDLTTLVPFSFLLVIVLMTYMLRSVVVAVSTFSVVVAGTVATLGFAGWSGVELTAGTAISPVSVMVLITASCIHITLTWMRAVQTRPPREAVAHSLSENIGPVFVTNVTTAVGFLCLNFSDSPPLRDVGNIVCVGILFGLAASLVFLPFGLSLSRRGAPARLPISAARLVWLVDLVVARRRQILVFFPLAVAISLAGMTRIGFDDSIFRYFDKRYEFRRDADAIHKQLTGLESLQFSFAAPEGSNVFEPQFLDGVGRFVAWLDAQPEVVSVVSILDILKSLNQSLNHDDPAFYAIADSRQANAQLLMLYELSLPVGMDLNTIIDIDRVRTRLTAILSTAHSAEIRQLAAAADRWLQENEPSLSSQAAGYSITFARLSQRNNAQMVVGLVFALLLVSAILLATLRSLKYGLISLAPNLLPAVLAFGFWGFTLRDMNLGSTVVATMTFGIVVDDTVHLLMNYLRRRRAGLEAEEAVRDTFTNVGAAIVITSIALIFGFAIMLFSGFAINQHIGALTVLVIGFALLADLLYLPGLLLTFKGKTH